MTTPDRHQAILAGLLTTLDLAAPTLDKFDRYYDGQQALNFLAPEIRAQVGRRLTSMVINWPRVIADSVQRRTYVEGFRVGNSGAVDQELQRLWQENDLDESAQMAQLDALVHGSSFLMVWGNDRDPLTPRVSVESAHQVAVSRSPGNMSTIASAVKRWTDGATDYATLYLPDEIVWFARPVTQDQARTQWQPIDYVDNPLGVVPVVPLVNRPRTLKLSGESELTQVIPLADAINKLATDLLVASEFSAMPRRYATGIQVPTGPDKERLQSEVAAYWDKATKGKTWLAGEGVNFGQFPEASLDNFVNAIQMFTAQIAAIAGLPPHFLGISTAANPASADAIRAAEATLVERAQEKQRTWAGAYEQAMRLAVAARDGIRVEDVPGELRRMETVWRDPATPTPAQSMDAAVKGIQAGIYDEVAAQEAVGLSPQARDAIADRRETALVTAATADVVAKLALAERLQQEQGLSQQAAFAAVGLLQAASAIGAPSRRTLERDAAGNITAIVEES